MPRGQAKTCPLFVFPIEFIIGERIAITEGELLN